MLSLLLIVATALATAKAQVCEDVYPEELDVAIYWARPSSDPAGPMILFDKSCPEFNSIPASFDRSKRTILFIHGLQPNMVLEDDRFGQSPETHPFIIGWLLAGWNVGVFQWTQYADESIAHFERAEGRIWTTDYFGDMEYTYLTRKGTVAVADGPMNETVADLLVRHYLGHFTPGLPWVNEIRWVGHSLGTQLALVAMNKIVRMQEDLGSTLQIQYYRAPDRVALLDPVMSPGAKPYLLDVLADDPQLGYYFSQGNSIMTFLSAIASRASALGIALEYYKSSFINRCLFSSHEDNTLVQHTAFEVVRFTQFGNHPIGQCISEEILGDFRDIQRYLDDVQYQMAQSHIAIVPYYLMTYFNPPLQCAYSGTSPPSCIALPGKLALSAGMPTDDVLSWMVADAGTGDKLCFHEFVNNKELPRFTGKADIDYSKVFNTADDLYYASSCERINT